jgi:hypothetical protein
MPTLLAIAGALGSLGLGAFVGALEALRENRESPKEDSEVPATVIVPDETGRRTPGYGPQPR